MTVYILSVLAGAVYGIGVGLLKYLILWRKMLGAPEDATFKSSAVTLRMMISFTVNAAALLAIYFLRNLLPLDFTFTIISAAICLSLSGKFYSLHKVYSKITD